MNKMDMNLAGVRGQVVTITRSLPAGAKFFTVDRNDVDKQFEEKKARVLQNPQSQEFLYNRSPRVIIVKDQTVLSQELVEDADNNTVIVFNKGMDSEARALAIPGGTGVTFQTTDEAMKDALNNGIVRIFADGEKTAQKANELNQAELQRALAEAERWAKIADSIRSAIASNKKKAQDYAEEIKKVKSVMEIPESSSTVIV